MNINIRDIRGLPAAITALLRGDAEALARAIGRDTPEEHGRTARQNSGSPTASMPRVIR